VASYFCENRDFFSGFNERMLQEEHAFEIEHLQQCERPVTYK